jgi:hypothetical protein
MRASRILVALSICRGPIMTKPFAGVIEARGNTESAEVLRIAMVACMEQPV